MKILLASADLLEDPNSWSGTPNQVLKALSAANNEVVPLTGLSTTRAPWHVALRVILGKDRYLLWMTRPTLKMMAKRLAEKVDEHQPDVVVGIGAQFLVYARQGPPFVLFSDAPWSTFRRTYSPYEPRFPIRSRWYERREASVARKAKAIVYSSSWAKDQLRKDYGVDGRNVSIVPLGANWTPAVAPSILYPSMDSLRILFVGRDWERKGGPLALEIVQELRKLGVKASIDLVGVTAERAGFTEKPDNEYVHFHGRIGLDTTKDLPALFTDSHIVLVPSKAECFGIIFAEAAAFGKPAVALDVDAVGEVVESGVTGLLFPQDYSAEDIAKDIIPLAVDSELYGHMAAAARSRFEGSLNWRHFGQMFSETLARVMRV